MEAIRVGTPVVTVSGVPLHLLTPDELTVVTAWRLIRDTDGGSLHVDLQQGRVAKFDVKPNVGNVQLLNEMLAGYRKLRD